MQLDVNIEPALRLPDMTSTGLHLFAHCAKQEKENLLLYAAR